MAVGAEANCATPFENRELHSVQVGRGAGIRTRAQNPGDSNTADTSDCNTQTNQCVTADNSLAEKQFTAFPKHATDTSLHEKCAIYVPQNLDDLAQVVAAWGRLPADLKSRILTMVNSAEER